MKKDLLLIILCLFSFAVQSKETVKPVSSRYGFIENKGQVIDQDKQVNSFVKYLWNGGGINVQLKTNSFSYEAVKKEAAAGKGQAHNIPGNKRKPGESLTVLSHRVDVELVGANAYPTIIAEGKSKDHINYYTVTEAATVHHFNKITYKDIYPGIDIEFIIGHNSDDVRRTWL